MIFIILAFLIGLSAIVYSLSRIEDPYKEMEKELCNDTVDLLKAYKEMKECDLKPLTSEQIISAEKTLEFVKEYFSKPRTIKLPKENNNEQIKTRKTRRVSKRTNKASKKRTTKKRSRNKASKKTTRLSAK